MVLDQFLTKDKITLFEKRLNEEDANYRRQHLRFLEALRFNVTDQNNIERPIILQETDSENVTITESFMNDLPMEVDGMLYPLFTKMI
jgi:hypothetical protein